VQRDATAHEASTRVCAGGGALRARGLARPAADRPFVTRYETSAVLDRRCARLLRFVAFA
jgi:hypothetical protein